MDPVTLAALGLGGAKAVTDIVGGVATTREARRSRRDAKEIALKRLALEEESLAQNEKQRAFQRLLKLMSGAQSLRENATASGRIRALRSA